MDTGNRSKSAKSGLDDDNDMPFPMDDFWNFGDDDVHSDDLELDEPLAFDRTGSHDDIAKEKSTTSGKSEAGANGTSRTKRRRPSSSIETADKAAPPPSWHSQAADKPHRRDMICEIAVLLKARKKRAPSQEWLQQLPSKAKRLEEGLYLKAQSLEAYLDRKTLKTRLSDLAKSIMKDHEEWKRKRLMLGHSSNSSMSSVASRQTTGNAGSRGSQPTPFGQQSSMGQSNQMLHQMGRSSVGSQQPAMGQQDDSNNSMAPAAFSGRSNGRMGPASSGAPSLDSKGSMGSGSNNVISELEQQRAINERLQRELEENLRQQNLLLQNQGSGQMGSGMANGMQMPGNSNATSNMMGSNLGMQGNSMVSNMQMMSNPSMNSNIMMQAALMGRLNNGQLSSNQQLALMQSMAQNGGNSSLGNPLMGAGSQNLLQQARMSSNQQLNMLRNSVLPGNPMSMGGASSQMGAMNMQGQNGFNPTMPPPSVVQRNAVAGGPRGPNDLGDPSPLSPNSFNW